MHRDNHITPDGDPQPGAGVSAIPAVCVALLSPRSHLAVVSLSPRCRLAVASLSQWCLAQWCLLRGRRGAVACSVALIAPLGAIRRFLSRKRARTEQEERKNSRTRPPHGLHAGARPQLPPGAPTVATGCRKTHFLMWRCVHDPPLISSVSSTMLAPSAPRSMRVARAAGSRRLGISPHSSAAQNPRLPFLSDARDLVTPLDFTVPRTLNAVRETQKLVLRTKKTYFDPSNVTLDFSHSNSRLFHKIKADSDTRTRKRILDPAAAWLAAHELKMALVFRKMQRHLLHGRVSLNDNLSPLQVGDLVLLSTHSTLLHIVVAAPANLKSNTYTFINNEGEITYGTKHFVRFRVPQVVPKHFLSALGLVVLEQKHQGIAPVGMPDSHFSRSKSALPKSLQKGKVETDAKSASEASFSNAGDDFIVAQAASQLLTDTDVKTYIVPSSARRVFSDFLTSVSIVSFEKITAFSNKLEYFHKVLQYDENNNLIDAARTIPLFELFDLVSNFSRTLSQIEKVKGSPDELRTMNSYVRKIRHKSSTSFGKRLPVNTKTDFAESSHSISSYIAFIIALSRSSRMWKINTQKSTKTPISVDILPLLKSTLMERALEYVKENGTDEFVKFYVNRHLGKNDLQHPPHYDSLVQMLKDMAVSNITNDHTLESVLGNLIRKIDITFEKEGIPKPKKIPYSYEYSKSRAFDIVMDLEKTGLKNPVFWSDALKLPGSGTSTESDMFEDYYNYVDSKFSTKEELQLMIKNATQNPDLNQEALKEFDDSLESLQDTAVLNWIQNDFYKDDPLAVVRQDFGNIPVYCIDSETAHEIDDGISIHEQDGSYVITVHVANPTSYLRPTSTLSEIAFRKGTTVYLPEGPTMMLPHIVSQMCGLNGEGKARTFAIEYRLNKADIDEHLQIAKKNPQKHPMSSLAKKVLKQLTSTSKVKFYTVENFPKGFTYEKVNKVLNDPENVKKFSSNMLEKGTHEDNLFKLFHISSLLRHVRVGLGKGLEMDSNGCKIDVRYTDKDPEPSKSFQHIQDGYRLYVPKKDHLAAPIITITKVIDQDSKSKSQQLVSNFMIAANYAGLVYAHKNKIPIIHRTQELGLEPTLEQELWRLSRSIYEGEKSLSVEQKSQILSVITSANYEVSRKKHESLGLDSYLNFTSPLRRYVDMANHWKLEDHILQLEGKDSDNEGLQPATGDLDYIASHLQSCEFTNKGAQKFSDWFWQATFLRNYFEMVENGQVEKEMDFHFLLRSDGKFGDVSAEITGFNNLHTTIVQNPMLVEKFASGEYKIGQVISNPRFKVIKLDCIEQEFAIELY